MYKYENRNEYTQSSSIKTQFNQYNKNIKKKKKTKKKSDEADMPSETERIRRTTEDSAQVEAAIVVVSILL
jgi:hypothetical protein